ncbi:MAG: universal stress protein [Acidimicrobiaceae bacterium]|nr:universal stress protein [Acidimicrobiaceae bacterium]
MIPRSLVLGATLDRGGGESGRIIVGIDGSESSLHALVWAAGVARRTNQKLIAVHVQPTVRGVMAASFIPESVLLIDEDQEGPWRELETLAQRVGRELDISVEFRRVRGDRSRELVRMAVADGADLVVVGRSRKAFVRLSGSVARRLAGAREAPIVVVVP